MNEWVLLGFVVLLVTANALFVAAEFSLVTADRARVEREAEQGDRRAAGVLTALKSLSTQLSGAQLGITVTSLVVGFIAEPSIAELLRGPLGLTGMSETATTVTAFTAAFVLATGMQMVFGELVPKNWAIAEPAARGAGSGRVPALVHVGHPPVDPPAERHGEPDPPCDGDRAGRGARLGEEPRRAGLDGHEVGGARDPGAGHGRAPGPVDRVRRPHAPPT